MRQRFLLSQFPDVAQAENTFIYLLNIPEGQTNAGLVHYYCQQILLKSQIGSVVQFSALEHSQKSG